MIDGWFKRTGRRMSWTEEDRLTQLATGVAQQMCLHWLTILFRAGEILQAFLPDGSISRQGRIMSTTSTTFCFYVEMQQDGRL
jgi:hypothetical protein